MLGIRVRIASLEDVTQGKLWAFGDPQRRLSKRKQEDLDLIRLAEVYPELESLYPSELREQIDRGKAILISMLPAIGPMRSEMASRTG